MLESIVIYDNRAVSATYRQVEGGRYESTVVFSVRKTQVDATGLEVAVENSQVVVTTDREPASAGIDPLHKLIDRVSDDNLVNACARPDHC